MVTGEPMGGGRTGNEEESGLKGDGVTVDLGGVRVEEGRVIGGVLEPEGGALRVRMFL